MSVFADFNNRNQCVSEGVHSEAELVKLFLQSDESSRQVTNFSGATEVVELKRNPRRNIDDFTIDALIRFKKASDPNPKWFLCDIKTKSVPRLLLEKHCRRDGFNIVSPFKSVGLDFGPGKKTGTVKELSRYIKALNNKELKSHVLGDEDMNFSDIFIIYPIHFESQTLKKTGELFLCPKEDEWHCVAITSVKRVMRYSGMSKEDDSPAAKIPWFDVEYIDKTETKVLYLPLNHVFEDKRRLFVTTMHGLTIDRGSHPYKFSLTK